MHNQFWLNWNIDNRYTIFATRIEQNLFSPSKCMYFTQNYRRSLNILLLNLEKIWNPLMKNGLFD